MRDSHQAQSRDCASPPRGARSAPSFGKSGQHANDTNRTVDMLHAARYNMTILEPGAKVGRGRRRKNFQRPKSPQESQATRGSPRPGTVAASGKQAAIPDRAVRRLQSSASLAEADVERPLCLRGVAHHRGASHCAIATCPNTEADGRATFSTWINKRRARARIAYVRKASIFRPRLILCSTALTWEARTHCRTALATGWVTALARKASHQ